MFPVQTVSDRMVAVKLRSEVGVVLIIAVYMPVECGSIDSEDYITELGFVEGLQEYDHVILMSDFNCRSMSQ